MDELFHYYKLLFETIILTIRLTLELGNPVVGRESCTAGVTGSDTTSCKDGKICGVFILSSFDIFEVKI